MKAKPKRFEAKPQPRIPSFFILLVCCFSTKRIKHKAAYNNNNSQNQPFQNNVIKHFSTFTTLHLLTTEKVGSKMPI